MYAESNKPKVTALIDDNEDDRYLFNNAVRIANPSFQLQTYPDGMKFMEQLSSTLDNGATIDLILLDLNMPQMDGFEVLSRIKQHPTFKVIPVVIYSTSNADADALRCFELGANAYLVKPLEFNDTVDMIRALDDFWFKHGQTLSNRSPAS